jgi:hypothetical protein
MTGERHLDLLRWGQLPHVTKFGISSAPSVEIRQ